MFSSSGREEEASFGNYSLTQTSPNREEESGKKAEIKGHHDDDDDEEDLHHGEEEEDDDDIVPDPDTVVEYDVESTGGSEVWSKNKQKLIFMITGRPPRRRRDRGMDHPAAYFLHFCIFLQLKCTTCNMFPLK